MNFQDIKDIFLKSSLIKFFFVRKVGSFSFFVKHEPFPVSHCIEKSVMINFLQHWNNFFVILFCPNPFIFKSHEDLRFE